MCTAATYLTKDFYFGRNLDLEYSYKETVTVTPRNYPFALRCGRNLNRHFALIAWQPWLMTIRFTTKLPTKKASAWQG